MLDSCLHVSCITMQNCVSSNTRDVIGGHCDYLLESYMLLLKYCALENAKLLHTVSNDLWMQ